MTLATAFAGLATKVSASVGAPFVDGTINTQGTPGHYDDDGEWVSGSAPTPRACKIQVDDATLAMRQTDGFVDGDRRMIVIALDGDISTDDTATISEGPFAGEWMIASVERDPAAIGFVLRGRRA